MQLGTGTSERLRFRNERTNSGVYRTTIGLEIVKRAVGISSGLQRIRNLTLWRGNRRPETGEKIADTAGAGNVDAPAPTTRETERERERD
jgi:hypothetical protein